MFSISYVTIMLLLFNIADRLKVYKDNVIGGQMNCDVHTLTPNVSLSFHLKRATVIKNCVSIKETITELHYSNQMTNLKKNKSFPLNIGWTNIECD